MQPPFPGADDGDRITLEDRVARLEREHESLLHRALEQPPAVDAQTFDLTMSAVDERLEDLSVADSQDMHRLNKFLMGRLFDRVKEIEKRLGMPEVEI